MSTKQKRKPQVQDPGLSITEEEEKQPEEEEEGRYVCIAGFAETTRDVANRLPKKYEIWSLNRCYVFLKRWDRWYEVHEAELYKGATGLREDGYLEMLKNSKVPVYMAHPEASGLENAHKLDIAEFDKAGFRHYYRTSIAHMLAHACYEHKVEGKKIKELVICGVDMSAYSEYSEQLPCVNYWLGVVEGLGIQLEIPTGSPLLKGPDYGTHDERVLWAQAKERLSVFKTKQAQLNANLNAVQGAMSEHNVIGGLFNQCIEKAQSEEGQDIQIFNADKFMELFNKRKAEAQEMHVHLGAELNSTLGQTRECQHWIAALNAPQTEDEEPEQARLAN